MSQHVSHRKSDDIHQRSEQLLTATQTVLRYLQGQISNADARIILVQDCGQLGLELVQALDKPAKPDQPDGEARA